MLKVTSVLKHTIILSNKTACSVVLQQRDQEPPAPIPELWRAAYGILNRELASALRKCQVH